MESMRPIVSGLLGAVISALLVAWILRQSLNAPTDGTISYGWRIRVVAFLMLGIALFIGYAALHASQSQRFFAFSIGGAGVAFAVWFVLEVLFVGARVSELHMQVWSPWRGTRLIPWNAITGYEFSPACGWYILHTNGFGKVRLSTTLIGLDQVFTLLEQHCEIDS